MTIPRQPATGPEKPQEAPRSAEQGAARSPAYPGPCDALLGRMRCVRDDPHSPDSRGPHMWVLPVYEPVEQEVER